VTRPLLLGEEVWPIGTELKLIKDTKTKAGCIEVTLKAGTLVKTGSDPFGVLGTNENETLVEVVRKASTQFGGGPRTLYAPIPNDALEPLKEPQDVSKEEKRTETK